MGRFVRLSYISHIGLFGPSVGLSCRLLVGATGAAVDARRRVGEQILSHVATGVHRPGEVDGHGVRVTQPGAGTCRRTFLLGNKASDKYFYI